MIGVVKEGPGPGIELKELAAPVPGDDEILVKVAASSVCGTDVHLYEWLENLDGPNWWDATLKTPVVLGHEFAGQVVEVGSKVTSVAPGDRITAPPLIPCGECDLCRGGNPEYCLESVVGLGVDGAMAEFLKISDRASIYKIPEHVSFEDACLLEPLAVALHAVEIADFKPGDNAAVLGPGPIGLLLMLVLRAAGAGRLMVTGAKDDAKRLALAEKLGADLVVNVDEHDPVEAARDASGGAGLDFVFEASGSPQTVSQGLAMARAFGKVILLGMFSQEASFDPNDLVVGNKQLLGSLAYDAETWRRGMNLLAAGAVTPSDIIDMKIPLADAAKGFEAAARKQAAKVVLIP